MFKKQRKANKERRIAIMRDRIALRDILVNTLIELVPYEKHAKN